MGLLGFPVCKGFTATLGNLSLISRVFLVGFLQKGFNAKPL